MSGKPTVATLPPRATVRLAAMGSGANRPSAFNKAISLVFLSERGVAFATFTVKQIFLKKSRAKSIHVLSGLKIQTPNAPIVHPKMKTGKEP